MNKPLLPQHEEDDAVIARSKELMQEVADKDDFSYGFPSYAGLIAVLGPGAVAVFVFLVDSKSEKKAYASFLGFGCSWFFLFMMNLYHYRTTKHFKNKKLEGRAWGCYWCMAVPGVVVHIGTLFVYLLCGKKVFEDDDLSAIVLFINLSSALFGSYAFIFPMVRLMQFDKHMASQLVQRWAKEAEELLQDIPKGQVVTRNRAIHLINDYRATQASINISGIRKPWDGLNSVPWLQSVFIGILTQLTVLFYYLDYERLFSSSWDNHSLPQLGFVAALAVVACAFMFVPLYQLELITRPIENILERMRKDELPEETHLENVQAYHLLLFVLRSEPMEVCLLRCPYLGISINVRDMLIKIPMVFSAVKFAYYEVKKVN